MNLTPRQLDVVTAVRNYRHLHGFSPTYQELADQLKSTKTTILEHVENLAQKRVIRFEKHKTRSIEIIAKGLLPDEERNTKLPVLGDIAAGEPIRAVDHREEVDLETLFRSKHGVYVLRVRGVGLLDNHLRDGDFVVIDRREHARNGERVLALVDGKQTTIKRFYKSRGGQVRLVDTYELIEPRILDARRVKVQGVVMGVLRSC